MSISRREKKIEYREVPVLYPMGPATFSIACALCDHLPERDKAELSERCNKCLCQVESGWEPNKDKLAKI